MADDPAPAYLEPYRRAVQEHGATWDAQLWRSPEAQLARFGVLCELVGLGEGVTPDPPRVVADIGCGTADLAAFIAQRAMARGAYIGIEGVPELAGAARERASEGAWPACTILDADFVADTGLATRLVREHGVNSFVISGALNTLAFDDACAVLGRFWDALQGVRGGVLAFNFLCVRRGVPAQTPGDPAVRYDADAMLAWALARGQDVRYRRDYLGEHDATIALRCAP